MPQPSSITVDLEEEQASLERHLANGGYDSPSEVIRAGLRALDREQSAFEDTVRERVRKSDRDRSAARPAEEVLESLRRRHFERWGKMPDET